MFLLGSNIDSSDVENATDSYNLGTYFTPANTGSNQSNLVAKATAYLLGGTQDSPDNYSAFSWWLRSGTVYITRYNSAMYVSLTGIVNSYDVSNSCALRPAFVLNLA